MSGIALGSGHLFMPAPVAASIGWPTGGFQWEVGLANVGYGVAGVMAPSDGREFWLTTIVVFSIFMLGAAVGTSGRCSPSTTSRRATRTTSSGTTS